MHGYDLQQKPFIVFWEITRACMLACRHCRARAQKKRHPDELTFEEAIGVIDQLTEFGKPYPLVVFTGGDPLMRDDINDLIKYSTDRGLRAAIAFSGTELATKSRLEKLKNAGIARIAISLDGSNPDVHDHFRGVKGTFEQSIKILEIAKTMGISRQINTTVSTYNLLDLPNLLEICLKEGVTLWDVFFIVPTGRAKAELMPSPQQFEDILNWLYDVTRETPLNVKSSAATHLRRIEYQRDTGKYRTPFGELYKALKERLEEIKKSYNLKVEKKRVVAGYTHKSLAHGDGIKRAQGITDGRGMFFISHIGDVYPSGFLPIEAGNVRETSLKKIYMTSNIFMELKDPDRLKGKCGVCEFRQICGGSRARAFALTGDYLEAEPNCIYIPAKYNK